MCFYIDPNNKKPKIAEKDIVCWKALIKTDGKYVSSWFSFEYEVNTLYSRGRFGWLDTAMIGYGYHSYSIRGYAYIGRGHKETVRKFIIPKGTKYYYNSRDKEYVSLSIKMVK